MLALMPCAIATRVTEAPGASHSARIGAFSAAVWLRHAHFLSVVTMFIKS